MISRKKDIEVLLLEADSLRKTIDLLMEESLQKKEIDPKLRVKIKFYLDCFRAALDYAAKDIADSCGREGKAYFPIIYEVKKFKDDVAKSFLGKELKKRNPDLYQYLESIQPYNTLYRWLKDFNDICNTKKHDNLVPQVPVERKSVTLENREVSLKVIDPSYIRIPSDGRFILGGVPITAGQTLSASNELLRLDLRMNIQRETVSRGLFFDGKIPARNLIEKVGKEVPKIIQNVYKLIEKDSI